MSAASFQFEKAVKERAKLRLALIGPAGSGKTYTALRVACAMATGKVALIDSEHGSASKYADEFQFDTLQLDEFKQETYIAAIKAAERAGYEMIVIDSLSHAWAGRGGALETKDKIAATVKGKNDFTAWGPVTKLQNELVDTIAGSGCHIIATIRSKIDHVMIDGKVKKIGLQPVQREGIEYEFDVVGDLDQDNRLNVTKSRAPKLAGAWITKPGEELARTLADWLKGAEPRRRDESPTAPVPAPASTPTTTPPATPTPTAPGMATQAQRDIVKDLSKPWLAVHGSNPPDKAANTRTWQEMVKAGWGKVSVAELTQAQADELIAKLRAETTGPTPGLFAQSTTTAPATAPTPAPAPSANGQAEKPTEPTGREEPEQPAKTASVAA